MTEARSVLMEKHCGAPQGDRGNAAGECLKAWQIEACFKCPVCGGCLTPSEQEHLLRKAGCTARGMGPFDMHEMLVASLEAENRLARMLDALLQRKFACKAAALLAAPATEFLSQWRTAFDEDAPAALWAAAVRPDLTDAQKRAVFGQVHMTMHANAHQRAALLRRLDGQARDMARLDERCRAALSARRQLQKEQAGHMRRQAVLEKEVMRLQREKAELEQTRHGCQGPPSDAGLAQECRRWRDEAQALSEQVRDLVRRLAFAQEENGRLRRDHAELSETHRCFAHEMQTIITGMRAAGNCDESCPIRDLCRKRILIVGGLTKMEALYRQLIEGCGGVFEYHDGYVKGGAKRLELSLKRADLVICPVDCNSHAACALVKNLGRKYNKPVHLLANSSLNAVRQVIGGDGSPTISTH